MKFFLTILAFCFALSVNAQDEVEFIVQRKAEPELVKTYLFKQQRLRFGSQRKDTITDYTCIINIKDTLFHYMHNIRPKDTSRLDVVDCHPHLTKYKDSSLIYLYSTYHYKTNDTVWECTRYKNDSTICYPYFSDSLVIRGKGVWKKRITYMLDKNVALNVGDTTYQCVKILVNYLRTYKRIVETKSGGFIFGTYKVYERAYYYLRKSDYLPVRVEFAEAVRKLSPYQPYVFDEPPIEMYKAIE